MKINVYADSKKAFRGFCVHFPEGYVKCERFNCDFCELGDRIRLTNVRLHNKESLFSDRNCLRQTKAGGGETYYNKPIVLTEKAMERLGIQLNLYNQIAIAIGGSGCFVKNVSGAIDCCLFSDKNFTFTIYRFETYGIPDARAVEKYESLFFMGLREYFK